MKTQNARLFGVISSLLILVTISSYYFYLKGENLGVKEGYKIGQDEGYIYGKAHGDSIGYIRGFNTKYEDLVKLDSVFRLMEYHFRPDVSSVDIINSMATIRSGKESYRSFKEFMDEINRELIDFMYKHLEMSPVDRKRLWDWYESKSYNLNKIYFAELVDLSGRKEVKSNDISVFAGNYSNVEDLEKILSKSLCAFTSSIMTKTLEAPISSLFVKNSSDKLCSYLVSGISKSVIKSLKQKAIIQDYNVITVELERSIKNNIAEYASLEVKTNQNFSQTFNREMFKDYLIAFTSTASISVYAEHINKIGYRLHQNFHLRVDNLKRTIEIILPEPEVLSSEPSEYLIKNLENGWFIKADKNKINYMKKQTAQILKEKALNAKNISLANKSAENFLRTIFKPIALSYPVPYDVMINFQGQNEIKRLQFFE